MWNMPELQSREGHLCRNTLGIGVHLPGAFAEYLRLPEDNVVPIPEDIDDEIAAIFDPFGNAVHTAINFRLCWRRCACHRRRTNRHHGGLWLSKEQELEK